MVLVNGLHCCIVCICTEYGDHHLRILLMLFNYFLGNCRHQCTQIITSIARVRQSTDSTLIIVTLLGTKAIKGSFNIRFIIIWLFICFHISISLIDKWNWNMKKNVLMKLQREWMRHDVGILLNNSLKRHCIHETSKVQSKCYRKYIYFSLFVKYEHLPKTIKYLRTYNI